ncbi:shikimate kinase [Nitratireductor pacificus]|uniref:Shikimate kinase n=1 Tax=Nitratireductor pacificus pht-3B TaxID=391937 RepID=K2M504_9HYPH|nr:shikimate kinase [Nitratireductor pacificus]EKF17176.1 shikimate kinase [Nitratireductor pacificus pht-3B]
MTVTDIAARFDLATLGQRLGARSVVFVGLMGAGKTVIGRRVAEMLGMPFVDSDHEIEAVSRMTVADLFSAYGEAEFRALERRVIARLLKTGPRVVSTGGGAFVNPATRRAVGRRGISVWLKADLPTLVERVGRKTTRPLLVDNDPAEVLNRLMEERYPLYAEADTVIHSRNEPKDLIAGEVIAALDAYLEEEALKQKSGQKPDGGAR